MNGNKLRSLRENAGLNQYQLSKILNLSPSTIGMYEQNRRQPDNNTLKSIADYFNASTDYLLDYKNTKINEELLEKETLKKILIKADYMKENDDLSDDELKRIMEFLKNNKKYIKGDK